MSTADFTDFIARADRFGLPGFGYPRSPRSPRFQFRNPTVKNTFRYFVAFPEFSVLALWKGPVSLRPLFGRRDPAKLERLSNYAP
jgi:hypothetical protein